MKEVIKAIEEYEKRAKQFASFLVDGRKEIGNALRENRKRKRISLREMAKRLGISAPYLSDIELGRRGISVSFYEKLRKL